MKQTLLAMFMLSSFTSMAKEYARVTCYNHKGATILDSYVSLNKEDVTLGNNGGFSAQVNSIKMSRNYYIDTDCEGENKEVLEDVKQIVIGCASGQITYNNGPICKGADVR